MFNYGITELQNYGITELRYSLLAVRCSLLAVRYSLLAASYFILDASCSTSRFVCTFEKTVSGANSPDLRRVPAG